VAIDALDNLVRVGQLKSEAADHAEAPRMVLLARTRWADVACWSNDARG
jgi:hypothetical protein